MNIISSLTFRDQSEAFVRGVVKGFYTLKTGDDLFCINRLNTWNKMVDKGTIEQKGDLERRHVTFLLHKLPAEKYGEFKDFCHKVAGGNYATGLSFLLELAKVNRGIGVLLRLVKENEERISFLESKDEPEPEEEEEEDPMPKTMGGGKNE